MNKGTAERLVAYCEEKPSNTLECNGQEVPRDAFHRLFSCIGTNFGEGDGVSTFNVPDERPYPTGTKVYIRI